jgi:DNA-binding transcriptional ArsR family regulator
MPQKNTSQAENTEVKTKLDIAVVIPAILEDYDLMSDEYRIYCRIARRAGSDGDCWESVGNIAAGCNQSERNVRYCLRILEKAGMITRTERESQTTLYKLANYKDWCDPSELPAIRKMVKGGADDAAPPASDAPKGSPSRNPLKGIPNQNHREGVDFDFEGDVDSAIATSNPLEVETKQDTNTQPEPSQPSPDPIVIQLRRASLSFKLNPATRKLITENNPDTVSTALDELETAIAGAKCKNPAGLFTTIVRRLKGENQQAKPGNHEVSAKTEEPQIVLPSGVAVARSKVHGKFLEMHDRNEEIQIKGDWSDPTQTAFLFGNGDSKFWAFVLCA